MQQTRAVVQSLDQVQGALRSLVGRWPAVGTLVFGMTILYLVGFSNFRKAHSAAHDTRHASGFPCH